MSKHGDRLSRLGVLAPAALSACMDASVLAVPTAGAIVSTVLKELSKAFMLKKWFHGSMSAKEAENLMMEKGKNGSFLVRESKAHPGDFRLTVRVRGHVNHVRINKQHNKYDVGSGESFDDLVGLIEHFRCYPMKKEDGDVLRLIQPVSGTHLRANEIQHKLQETENIEDVEEQGSDLDKEFQSLQMLDNLHLFTTKEGAKYENVAKNRYRNILPYDQTRVILRRNGEMIDDYINASYITSPQLWDSSNCSSNESLNSVRSFRSEPKLKSHALVFKSLSDEALKEVKRCFKLDKINGNLVGNPAKNKLYIATQGCLSNTKGDFWRMVWQEDLRIIVMITNEVEKGKRKCERYWPHVGEQTTYDNLIVKCLSETHCDHHVVREMNVSDGSCYRAIYQYQFMAWPDHGIPSSADGILAFMDDINTRTNQIMQNSDRPEQKIICVHCSAGVGRTGTFIVLDTLLDKIKSIETARGACIAWMKIGHCLDRERKIGTECDIDVYNTVKTIRGQRSGMVQNKSQYQFIYMALRHYIEKRPSKYSSKVYSIEL